MLLKDEIYNLLQRGFRADQTMQKLMLEYKLNTKYKYIKQHPLFQRHLNLTEIEQKIEAFRELYPEQAPDNIMKQAAS